jgi:aspartyl/asparaginyl-tRNA synthetase
MTKWVYIRDIADYVGQEVTLKGWVYNRTDKANCSFWSSATARGSFRQWRSRRNCRRRCSSAPLR